MKKIFVGFIVLIILLVGVTFVYKNYSSNKVNPSNTPIESAVPTATPIESYAPEDDTTYTKEGILGSYTNRTYVETDIDNDGISDLIIKDGTSEADYTYYFYKAIRADYYILVGHQGAGHTILFKEPNARYVTMLYGQMDHEIVSHISIDNNTINTVTIEEKEIDPGATYDSFTGLLEFTA